MPALLAVAVSINYLGGLGRKSTIFGLVALVWAD